MNSLESKIKTTKETICEIWAEADKLLKLKADKTWSELELNSLPKALEQLQVSWNACLEFVTYWYNNIFWLQSRFPDGIYKNIIGLCNAAERDEFEKEHDYSLNPGRYVGVNEEGDGLSRSDFLAKLKFFKTAIRDLSEKSEFLEKNINSNLEQLFYDLERN